MTPAEHINAMLKKELAAKQRVLASEVAAILGAQDSATRRQHEIALRRVEKSIALRIAKLLCPHTKISRSSTTQRSFVITWYRCSECKTTVAKK